MLHGIAAIERQCILYSRVFHALRGLHALHVLCVLYALCVIHVLCIACIYVYYVHWTAEFRAFECIAVYYGG